MGGGLQSTDRVKSSVIWEELKVEPLLLHTERSQLRWFRHLIRMPPGCLPVGGLPGMAYWDEVPGSSKGIGRAHV